MSLRTAEFLRAAVPRGLKTLLPVDIDPLAERLARKQRLRLGTLVILSVAEKHLTPYETLGVMYFSQLVKSADDAIDRNPTDFTSRDELRGYLLHSEVPGTGGAQVKEVLERCLSCFETDKQGAINSFLEDMVGVHMHGVHRGVAGTYSFKDALDYRRVTNDPLLETLAELTDSNKVRFVHIGRAWQLIEDGLDWTEDAQEQAKNLFIGMATDTWHERGDLKGEELDYLLSILGRWQRGRLFDFRLNELRGIKSLFVKSTREKYRQEILNEMPAIGGNFVGIMGTVANILF